MSPLIHYPANYAHRHTVTSFTPLWDAPPSYTPTLQPAQGAPQIWKPDQAYTQPFPSSILLTVPCSDPAQCSSSPFTFKGANIITEVTPPSSAAATSQNKGNNESGPKSVIADDASGLIKYSGWSAVGKDNAVVPPGAGDYGGTLSMTGSGNASAIVRFRGMFSLGKAVSPLCLSRHSQVEKRNGVC